MDLDRGVHEQAPSIGKSLDQIVSLGFVSLSNCQIEDLCCPENAIARRLLRGHHSLPLLILLTTPVNRFSGEPCGASRGGRRGGSGRWDTCGGGIPCNSGGSCSSRGYGGSSRCSR